MIKAKKKPPTAAKNNSSERIIAVLSTIKIIKRRIIKLSHIWPLAFPTLR